ncbi:hypothetical protein CORC01_09530 [Colletotrichum orchidophilum]|uniref:Uncharacterized protein n=1 Tax=Colletotrichum orchidophilum TaxID=1209926 RepID=A0A1G4B1C7_9PEZI|nr:uncharacterized protein CORC01_09530 [Colletotrichum orchidophilum]OHE95143.1 hypothetical protein CORC01_09530 [Colletotrichum orchidophilum]
MPLSHRLVQALAEARSKARSVYHLLRDRGVNDDARVAVRILLGTLHSLWLLFEDFAEQGTSPACPDHTLFDDLADLFDDSSLEWSTGSTTPKGGPPPLSGFVSSIYKIQLQLESLVRCNSWADLLVRLSTTGHRRDIYSQDLGQTIDSTPKGLEIDGDTCMALLLSAEFDKKLDDCHTHRQYVAEREIKHPEFAAAAKLLPDLARQRYTDYKTSLHMLFHSRKSSHFLQWLMEYARQEWPQHFNFGSGALSMTPLHLLMSRLSDDSVTPFHVAASLGLPRLCEQLIQWGVDLNKPSSLGTPLYCALLGPTALLGRSDDPAQLVSDCIPTDSQEETLRVLLDAGASCTTETAGPCQDENFSLATLGFLICQEIRAPKILLRVLKSGVSIDSRFVQLFHGKNSLLEYWPSPLKPPTRSFLEGMLPAILDRAIPEYDSYNDISLLATGIYEILDHFDLARPSTISGSRPLDVSDTLYAELVREAVQDCETAVVRRLILDPRWNPNASMAPQRAQSIASSDDGVSFHEAHKATTILHYAVEADEIALVAAILTSREDVDVQVRNHKDQTPLMLSESPEVFKLLMDHGARTTDTDESGRNVWHFAAANSDTALLDCLQEYDKHWDQNLRGVMTDGQTPIAQAVIYPFSQMKRRRKMTSEAPVGAIHMLKTCKSDAAYLKSPTPLVFLAVEWGSADLLRSLIDFGADPLEIDRKCRNALHFLNVSAREPLISILLSLDFENILNDQDSSPAETVFQIFNDTALFGPTPDKIFNHPASFGTLDAGVYSRLLGYKDILNSRDDADMGLWERFSLTVLATDAPRWPAGLTAQPSLQTAVECLIKKGALAKYEEESGQCGLIPVLSGWPKVSASHDRFSKWLEDILYTILKASTKLDGFNEAPAAVQCLRLAIKQEHVGLVKQLLDLGVSVHARFDNVSALEYACSPRSSCDLVMFEKLLEHADPEKLNDVDRFKIGLIFRLLDYRVSHRMPKLSALMSSGCNPNATTPSGMPVVVSYIMERQTEPAMLLLNAGADPSASSNMGLDAGLAAALRGNLVILHKLKSIGEEFNWAKLCTHAFSPGELTGLTSSKIMHKCNALHLAASSGHADTLTFYLESLKVESLSIEAPTADGWRPIHFAAAYDSDDGSCVRVLLEHGADPTKSLPDGYWNPLMLAVHAGNISIAQPLLELEPDIVSRMNLPRAFTIALKRKSERMIDLFRPFLDNVIIPSPDLVKDRDGRCKALGAVMELLLDDGNLRRLSSVLQMVDRETLNSVRLSCGKCSPLILATVQGQFHLADLLLGCGMTTWNFVDRCSRHLGAPPESMYPSCTTLHMALMQPEQRSHHTIDAFVQKLIEQIDWTRHELSPVHCAVISGQASRVRLIANHVKKHAHRYVDILQESSNFPTEDKLAKVEATDKTASDVSKPMLDAILKHIFNRRVLAADLEPKFKYGWTPLLMAVDETNLQMMEILIEYGADINLPDEDDFGTPLHKAVDENFEQGVRLLLENGANPNRRNSVYQTPLFLAVELGQLGMAKLLVEFGADVHACDTDGMSLLNTCGEKSKNPKMFIWLMELGLDPYRLDKAGYTPVHDIILGDAFSSLTFNYGFDFYRILDIRKGFLPLLIEFNPLKANFIIVRLLKRLPMETAEVLVNANPHAFVSPLCNAVLKDQLDCIPTLLRHGADIDAEGCDEGSALMAACVKGSLDAVKILVYSGAGISYVAMINDVAVLRNALVYAGPFPQIVRWILVDRYVRQRRIEEVLDVPREEEVKPWSGGQVAGYELSGIGCRTGRRFGESGLEYLRRLDQIRWELRGQMVRPVALQVEKEG